jgi:hypothetical protein
MYGMVNKAVEEMVTNQFDEETWEKIKAKAAIEEEIFISNESYPDEVTYRLVAAASETLGLRPDQILEAFGIHWMLHTAPDGYGELLAAGGVTLSEFLLNLPSFHTRLTLIFPKLNPPTFKIKEISDDSLHLHYYSHRMGLTSFVIGILKGLGIMYKTQLEIALLNSRETGSDHEEFLITWQI